MSTASTPAVNGRLAILRPFVQAGFAVLLLGVVCWQMHRQDQQFRDLMQLQSQTNKVIEQNTTATLSTQSAIRDLTRIVTDKL